EGYTQRFVTRGDRQVSTFSRARIHFGGINMASIKTYALSNSAIIRIAADKDLINLSPSYQRRGGIWNLERKQLLIDSILNEYDIPKLYFHHILPWYSKDKFDSKFKYAVIDGRQRLSTILDFLDDKFPLA